MEILRSNSDFKLLLADCQKLLTSYPSRLLDWADRFLLASLPVIPTLNKGAFIRGWKTKKFTISEISRLVLSGKANAIGLRAGWIENEGMSLFFLDIDSTAVLEKIRHSSLSYLLQTLRVENGHSPGHLYLSSKLRLEGDEKFQVDGSPGGELRCSGYVISPPSRFIDKGVLLDYRFVPGDTPIIPLIEGEIFELCRLLGISEVKIEKLLRVKFSHSRVPIPAKRERSDPGEGVTLARTKRYFGLSGYSGLCPFHEDHHSSFSIFQAEDGKNLRCKCHHADGYNISIGELDWYYLQAPVKDRARSKHELGKLSPGFYTMLNERVKDKIRNVDGLKAFLNSDQLGRIKSGKRKVNREGYRRALNFIFGLSLLPDFLLPVDILSEIIGVNFQECSVFIHKLETMGLVVRIDKRSRTIVYQSGELLKAYHIGKE